MLEASKDVKNALALRSVQKTTAQFCTGFKDRDTATRDGAVHMRHA